MYSGLINHIITIFFSLASCNEQCQYQSGNDISDNDDYEQRFNNN